MAIGMTEIVLVVIGIGLFWFSPKIFKKLISNAKEVKTELKTLNE